MSCPLFSTLALTPPPAIPLFLLFQKVVAVENKFSVLGVPGNKFSGRARDKINNLSRPNLPAPPPQDSGSNGRPLSKPYS